MSIRAQNEAQDFGRRIVIGIAATLAIGVVTAILSWVFLPAVPAGGWSWLVRAIISLLFGVITAYIAWIVIAVFIAGGVLMDG